MNTKILQSSPLFSNLDSKELDYLIESANPIIKKYRQNDIISIAGSSNYGLYLLIDGKIRIVKNSDDEESIMSMISKGELFGEAGVFLEKPIWPATAIAATDCEVFIISREYLFSNSNPITSQIIQNVLAILSSKAIGLTKRVQYLSTLKLEDKIINFLSDRSKMVGHKTIHLSMDRNELAVFLGTTRPSLSRALAKLKNDGKIDYYKNTFKLNK